MNVLWFVLMVCWNQHMASIEMYIFSVDVVLITCWNIRMAQLFWVGMHQRSLSIPASGANPYLITRLYSLKYKVTCVVHESRAWISHYIFLSGNNFRACVKVYEKQWSSFTFDKIQPFSLPPPPIVSIERDNVWQLWTAPKLFKASDKGRYN